MLKHVLTCPDIISVSSFLVSLSVQPVSPHRFTWILNDLLRKPTRGRLEWFHLSVSCTDSLWRRCFRRLSSVRDPKLVSVKLRRRPLSKHIHTCVREHTPFVPAGVVDCCYGNQVGPSGSADTCCIIYLCNACIATVIRLHSKKYVQRCLLWLVTSYLI